MSLGNRTVGEAGSCQLAPRSSERKTDGPQCALSAPTSTRGTGPRRSSPTAYTASPVKCGPSNSHVPARRRPRKSPLRVPTASSTSDIPPPPRSASPVPVSLRAPTDNGPEAASTRADAHPDGVRGGHGQGAGAVVHGLDQALLWPNRRVGAELFI